MALTSTAVLLDSNLPFDNILKRSHFADAPRRPVRTIGGFLLDDEDDDVAELPTPKKRMVETDRPPAVDVSIYDLAPIPDTECLKFVGRQQPSQSPPAAYFCSVEGMPTPTFEPPLLPEQFAPLDTEFELYPADPCKSYRAMTCNGTSFAIRTRRVNAPIPDEALVGTRSRPKEVQNRQSFYGIDISHLRSLAADQYEVMSATRPASSPEQLPPSGHLEEPPLPKHKARRDMLWMEKYRARSFIDLCGDDATNRQVLRWLKRWDPIVFPASAKARLSHRRQGTKLPGGEEKPHRKILLLAGPPGLGKTTLAHVCARQAGYEVLEINASDDRSRDVVDNRIRISLGTESVKAVGNRKSVDGSRTSVARPACVIVDEVDGAMVGSAGSGEGGFVKALIDLVLLDQKSSGAQSTTTTSTGRKKKGDSFRLMRPLILICNDLYDPSLRPLRTSNLAEVIHVGKPPIDAVVGRLATIFGREGIPCDKDAARKLCEAAWGFSGGLDAKRGAENPLEGDLRSILVIGEWVAGRFRALRTRSSSRLTRQWIERNIAHGLAMGVGGARGLGRGGVRDIVNRIFQDGGGFPRHIAPVSDDDQLPTFHDREQPKTQQLAFSEHHKRQTMERLRQLIETSGEIDKIVTDIFSEYPNREFNDDLFLAKPNEAYEWLHFHDTCSSRLYSAQSWELAPYLGQAVLACHHLFASSYVHHAAYSKPVSGGEDDTAAPCPFSGPKADFAAFEAARHTRAQLQVLQSQLSPVLMRSFRSPEDIAVGLLPYLIRLVSPDVKPVVVRNSQGMTASVRRESEKTMVRRVAEILAENGISLHRGMLEAESGDQNRAPQFVYRMEPDLDALCIFETASATHLTAQAPTRYAVRQVLDQELRKTIALRESASRQARYSRGKAEIGRQTGSDDKENAAPADTSGAPAVRSKAPDRTVKRDFFGRIIAQGPPLRVVEDGVERKGEIVLQPAKVWVTFHEGINNAVRKPLSFHDFLRAL